MRFLQHILRITSLITPFVAADSSNNQSCLNGAEARRIINTWLPLNVQPPSAWLNDPYYNNTAMKLLAPEFQLYSDSDNYVGSPPPNNPVRSNVHATHHTLIGFLQPPGTVTAASRADWIDQQVENESNPDIVNITVTVLNLVHDCNQIAARWRYEGYYEWAGPEDGLYGLHVPQIWCLTDVLCL